VRRTQNYPISKPSRLWGQLAALEPPAPAMRALFGALYGNQDATNAFLSAITGAIPLPDFMSSENVGRIMAAARDMEFHG
jgi:hypothetical protein